jgi:isoleucyl-tRNA synthetase
VHLDSWPSPSTSDHKTIEYMREVRRFASLGLEARMKAKINVRQPLSRLTIKSSMKLSSDYLDLIKDEVNVKEVILDKTLSSDIDLDTKITPELKEEGNVREFIRAIQDLRKSKQLTIRDKAVLIVDTDSITNIFISKNKKIISEATLLRDIVFRAVNSENIDIGDYKARLNIEK